MRGSFSSLLLSICILLGLQKCGSERDATSQSAPGPMESLKKPGKFTDYINEVHEFFEPGGDLGKELKKMEESDNKAKAEAHRWVQGSYETMKAAHRVMIHSTKTAQNVLMRDGLNANQAMKGNFNDEMSKLQVPTPEPWDRWKVVRDHHAPEQKPYKPEGAAPTELKGQELVDKRVRIKKGGAWGLTGWVTKYTAGTGSAGGKYTVQGDDGKAPQSLGQDDIRELSSLLVDNGEEQDPLPGPSTDFTKGIGALKSESEESFGIRSP